MTGPQISRRQAWCKLAILIADGLPAPRDIIFFPASEMLDIVVDDAGSLWAWTDAVCAEAEEPRWYEQLTRWHQKATGTWHGYFLTVKTYDAAALGEPVRAGMAAVRAVANETPRADPDLAPEVPAVAKTGQPGDRRAESIAGLRELADWLEATPGVPFIDIGHTFAWEAIGVGASDEAQAAEIQRVAELIGVEPVIGAPGGPHGRVAKKFSGDVKYELLHCWKKSAPADEAATDIPLGGGKVAGSVGMGPATAPSWWLASSKHGNGFRTPEVVAELEREDPTQVWLAVRRRGINYHDLGQLGGEAGDEQLTLCGRSTYSGRRLPLVEARDLTCPRCPECHRKSAG